MVARLTRARPDGKTKAVKKRAVKPKSVTDLDTAAPVRTTSAAQKSAAKKAVAKKSVVITKSVETAAATPKSVASVKPVAKPVAKPKPRKIAKVWYEPREPRPERLSATERLDLPPLATGAELVERVSWAIERELNQIEMIVGGHHLKPAQRTEAERRARTLASLARTLSVVTQLREKNLSGPGDDNDDAMPRDLDELRETLARRLERLVAEQAQSADGEPDGR